MAIGRTPARILREGGNIVSVSTVPDPNLTGITDYHPKAVERPERTAVVDTAYLDHSRLATHIGGSIYNCVYYSQVLGRDDALRPQALDASNVHQQYHCYRDMVLRFTTPFNPSVQDLETKEFRLAGEADMYYMLPPNVGDMIVGDAGGGNTAIITVTSTEKLSYMKHSAYRIEFQLVAVNDMDRLNDLEKKVVRTFYYDESLLAYFNAPFLTEDAKQRYDLCGRVYEDLKEYYINMFWDQQMRSYRVPGPNNMAVFDPMQSDYCRYIGLEAIDRPATNYNVGSLDLDTVQTLWWLLKGETLDALKYVTADVRLYTTRSFRVHYGIKNISYSRYTHTFYPIERRPFTPYEEPRLSPSTFLYPAVEASTAYPTVGKDAYVFSKAFYAQDVAQCTTLETTVLDMLGNKAVDPALVLSLATGIRERDFLEQFYFIPIIMTLLAYAKRRPIWL